MGLGKGESWDVGKPKSRKKTNDAVEETGCWVRLRSIGSCAVFLQDLKWIALLVASVLIVVILYFPLKSFYVVLKLHFLIAMDFVVSINFICISEGIIGNASSVHILWIYVVCLAPAVSY